MMACSIQQLWGMTMTWSRRTTGCRRIRRRALRLNLYPPHQTRLRLVWHWLTNLYESESEKLRNHLGDGRGKPNTREWGPSLKKDMARATERTRIRLKSGKSTLAELTTRTTLSPCPSWPHTTRQIRLRAFFLLFLVRFLCSLSYLSTENPAEIFV